MGDHDAYRRNVHARCHADTHDRTLSRTMDELKVMIGGDKKKFLGQAEHWLLPIQHDLRTYSRFENNQGMLSKLFGTTRHSDGAGFRSQGIARRCVRSVGHKKHMSFDNLRAKWEVPAMILSILICQK